MKNIGFIKAAQDIEQTEQMLNLMKEHGCVSVHVEEVRSSNRSRWQDFVDGLDDYDIAVLYSFDNAFRNIHDMIFFLRSRSESALLDLAEKAPHVVPEFVRDLVERWGRSGGAGRLAPLTPCPDATTPPIP